MNQPGTINKVDKILTKSITGHNVEINNTFVIESYSFQRNFAQIIAPTI